IVFGALVQIGNWQAPFIVAAALLVIGSAVGGFLLDPEKHILTSRAAAAQPPASGNPGGNPQPRWGVGLRLPGGDPTMSYAGVRHSSAMRGKVARILAPALSEPESEPATFDCPPMRRR